MQSVEIFSGVELPDEYADKAARKWISAVRSQSKNVFERISDYVRDCGGIPANPKAQLKWSKRISLVHNEISLHSQMMPGKNSRAYWYVDLVSPSDGGAGYFEIDRMILKQNGRSKCPSLQAYIIARVSAHSITRCIQRLEIHNVNEMVSFLRHIWAWLFWTTYLLKYSDKGHWLIPARLPDGRLCAFGVYHSEGLLHVKTVIHQEQFRDEQAEILFSAVQYLEDNPKPDDKIVYTHLIQNCKDL